MKATIKASYHVRDAAPPSPGGYVARIRRDSPPAWLDAADPTGATWAEAPGEPWPLARDEGVKGAHVAEIPAPPLAWGDQQDVRLYLYPAGRADPVADDWLDFTPLRNYQPSPPDLHGRLSVSLDFHR